MTDKKVNWSITGSWLIGLALAIFGAATANYNLIPQYGICDPDRLNASPIQPLTIFGLLAVSTCTIIGTSIYL